MIPKTLEEFESRREIERLPSCPPLSPDEIKKITETVFVASNPQKADILFVFGSSHGDRWPQVAELYTQGLAPVVYIAGGVGKKTFETGRVLSHIIRDDFLAHGVPNEAIVVDEHSQNTLEDAVNGKNIFDQKGIRYSKILFACKTQHSGRCARTLKKVFPHSILFPFTYDFVHGGQVVSFTEWWKSTPHSSAVWGEYQRIQLYTERGDIAS